MKRIIPRLDIKGANLVKGIHLEGLRVLGKPADFARFYYENGADELLYTDVVASLYGRNSLADIISKTAQEIFIPITVAGGLRNLQDVQNVLRAGADKVSLNTAAIKNPDIIGQVAQAFGSSTLVITIEAIRQQNGSYLAYTDNGREFTGVDAIAWAKEAAERGAGELVITSIDREGTGRGFDLDLIRAISSQVDIPVVAHGGAGKEQDIVDALQAGADAVAIASVLHYAYIQQYHSEKEAGEGNTQFLQSGRGFSKVKPLHLPDIKAHLLNHQIKCRS